MKFKRLAAGMAVVAAGALVLTGCTPPRESEVIEGTSITVAWNDYYYAFNDGLTNTNATSNAVVNYMAKSGFSYYDDQSNLVWETDFGKVEKLSDDPLTVKYTVNDGVKWSDGTQVDAADMLLYWAAYTTHVTNGEGGEDVDEDTGTITSQTGTFWDTGAAPDYGLDFVTDTPTIGDDNRSVTLTYSKYYVDWELAFAVSPVSAHGTVELAYPDKYAADEDGAKAAKADLIKAIQDKDYDFLGPVSEAFNKDYAFLDKPSEPQKLWGTGAYNITDINNAGGYVTLEANPLYTWGPSPKYEKITVRVIPDMQDQLTALQNGEVQIVSGQPTTDIAQLLEGGIEGVDYKFSSDATYEHIDLQVTNGGPFDPATYGGDADKALKVRQAFLKVIPRQEILDKLIIPLQPNAVLRNSQMFIPGTDGAKAAEKVNGYADMTTPDVDGAKALLAEAGVTTPIDVRFMFGKSNPRRNSEYELIKAAIEPAGFNLINSSTDTWGSDVFTQPDIYDAALFGWQSTSTAVGESAANYQTGGANNPYGWSDTDLDSLFTELASETDTQKQQDLLVQAEQIVGEEAWSVPIFQFPGATAWSSNVTGVTTGFLSPTYFWNFWEWAPVEGAASASE